MRVLNVAQEGYATAAAALRRTTLQDNPRVESIVREIIAEVRADGDSALLKLGRRFDSPVLDALEVPRAEWLAAADRIPAALRDTVRSEERRVGKECW